MWEKAIRKRNTVIITKRLTPIAHLLHVTILYELFKLKLYRVLRRQGQYLLLITTKTQVLGRTTFSSSYPRSTTTRRISQQAYSTNLTFRSMLRIHFIVQYRHKTAARTFETAKRTCHVFFTVQRIRHGSNLRITKVLQVDGLYGMTATINDDWAGMGKEENVTF